MITAAAVCPHPPLLFRELTGTADVAGPLRAACLEAVRAALSDGPERVVVAGGAEVSGAWDPSSPVDIRRYGGPPSAGPADARRALPLALGVGVRLLAEAGWTGPAELVGVSSDASPKELGDLAADLDAGPGRVALLVMGDGGARRGPKAPGFLDERTFALDDETARALAEGDGEALLDADPGLAQELMIGGRAAFGLLGAVGTRRAAAPRARLLYRDDPFGVLYIVALWSLP